MITFKQFLSETYTEAHSTAHSDGVDYDLNVLFRATAKQPIVKFKVADLKWVLPFTKTEQRRVEHADLTTPILVVPHKGKLLALDGAHRLRKAVNDGVEELPGKLATAEQLEKARI
jgi:hypothetical protein